MTGVDREAIGTLLVCAGNGCLELLNDKMRDLDCNRLEIDELWAFVGKKQRQVTKSDDRVRVVTGGLSSRSTPHGSAPLYAPHQCVLEEDRELRCGERAALRSLQLRASPPISILFGQSNGKLPPDSRA
jgi:hypothetical protein